MMLLLDAGNSRVKWGVHDGRQWLRQGAVPHAQVDALSEAWRGLPPPQRIIGCNVAGPHMQQTLTTLCQQWPARLYWISAQARQCGVNNGYTEPMQLGSDRWAALIAARKICQGACLVVTAGTALTIDALSAEGVFLGGLIVPGVELMRTALQQGTAGVQPATGKLAQFPTNTADAVYSGTMNALAGAVERMAARLEQRSSGKIELLLSGGSADKLAPLFTRPAKLVDNLVLEGLLIIAQEGRS